MASDDDDESYVAVFHPGSCMTAVGIAGDDAPRVVFPTLASPTPEEGTRGYRDGGASFGDVAQRQQYRKSTNRRAVVPYDHGVVTDWDAMEGLLRHSLESELPAHMIHDSLIITETPWAAPRYAPGHREAWLELAFESCGKRAVLCASQPLLALMATGWTRGAILSVGHQVTTACTFGDGGQPVHFCRSDVGGADVTAALGRSMASRGYGFASPAEREVLRDVKEKLGCVCNAPGDPGAVDTAHYEFPDGQVIECLGEDRSSCFDALFAPAPELGTLSVSETLVSALLSSPDAEVIDPSRRFNVALCGATSLASGFTERVQADLDRLLAAATAGDSGVTGGLSHTPFPYFSQVPFRAIAPPDRKYLEWIGGSILGSISSNADRFVTKAAYDEEGAGAVGRLFDHFSWT